MTCRQEKSRDAFYH